MTLIVTKDILWTDVLYYQDKTRQRFALGTLCITLLTQLSISFGIYTHTQKHVNPFLDALAHPLPYHWIPNMKHL